MIILCVCYEIHAMQIKIIFVRHLSLLSIPNITAEPHYEMHHYSKSLLEFG